MRTRYRTVLAAVAAVAVAATACAQPPERPTIAPDAHYAALGSSFAAGPGLGSPTPNGCLRSTANYASVVATTLKLRLTDVSCAGATVDNVLSTPQETEEGEQRPPQIAAVTRDTRLVTITIGGNDIDYAATLELLGCGDTGACPSDGVDVDVVRTKTDALSGRLVSTINAIRTAAPQAEVLLVTYPQIVPADGTTCPALALTTEHAQVVAAMGAGLDAAFRNAAATTHIRLIDVYAASADHTACARDPWVAGWIAPGDPADRYAYHPTAAGMKAVADLVVAAVG